MRVVRREVRPVLKESVMTESVGGESKGKTIRKKDGATRALGDGRRERQSSCLTF